MALNLLILVIVAYFAVLLGVAYYTSRNANNDTFFIGNKNSHWALVAFGMIGTSLSGVTFVSVPGTVEAAKFSYFQVVLGYFIGYFAVAFVLLPLYYKLGLTSIYNYLGQRFGTFAYKTGALFFIVSRTLGATLRLYLVINVLQVFLLSEFNIPFWLTTVIILLMILLYTYEGGVKTIVWTDTLQTFFMLLALIAAVVFICGELNLGVFSALEQLDAKGYLSIFNTDVNDKKFFLKQIIGGAFITISMTGLDQEMMQKNISVKTLAGAQKNMVLFSSVMVLVNFLFLVLGGVLYLYAAQLGLDVKGDELFPTIALKHMPVMLSLIFIIGLISALFPSADGAITALTSSFCIDILGISRNKALNESQRLKTRKTVHLLFALLFLLLVLFFKVLDNKSIIGILLDIAGYTYGPLLGLFAFGILTRYKIEDKLVTIVCFLAPLFSYVFQNMLPQWLNWKYQTGIELLVLNGLLTFAGLYLIRVKKGTEPVK